MRADPLLTGLVVLDLTRVLAGPYCTRLLADLGARVVKVERPGEGDETRRGYAQIEDGRTDQATYFIRVNAGKESVAIDLSHPKGREVVLDLARHADVAVENFVPGVVAKLGCDHAALSAVKPDLVYCSISGFGQTGPMRQQPAFAHIINAISGMMHLEQGADPAPRVAYIQAADVLAGTHAVGAIMAALWRRAQTGRGAYLDVSMLECLVAAEDITYGAMLNGGAEYRGSRPGMIVHGIGGRYLALQTVGAPQLWSRLAALMDRPELADDPRFATPAGRRENWNELQALICAWIEKKYDTVDAAVKALSAARVPAVPVLSPAEVVAHPHLAARRGFPSIDHPTRTTLQVTATPFHVDGRPLNPGGAAPYRVGEHTRAVLSEVLGYPPERIEALRKLGAVETV